MLGHLDDAFDTAQRTARGEQGRISVAIRTRPRSIPWCRVSFASSDRPFRWCP
jgi:hypothetical protein